MKRPTDWVVHMSMAVTAALGLSGCDKSPGSDNAAASGQPDSAALPASMVLSAAPDAARDVSAVKRDAKENDEVIIRGIIGGSKSPFVAGRAVFTIVDASLPSCAGKGEDHCATPWDYCCEPPPNLSAASATIQLVGPDGKPLRIDVLQKSGLKPLAEIVVKGRVETKQDAALVIAGSAFFVKS